MFCRNFLSSKGFSKSFVLCLVNSNITAMLTTNFPVRFLFKKVQRTPELRVISVGTGTVYFSVVNERYTAALASLCHVATLSFREDVLNTKMKGTT